MPAPRRAFVVLLALTLLPQLAAAQTAVTGCGQQLDGDGYLTGDLDCTGFVGPEGFADAAVVLTEPGTLDLAGFTISGASTGVLCQERCEIANGTIRDTANGGIIAENVTLRNMALVSAGYSDGDGVATIYNYHTTLIDSSITGSGRMGVLSNRSKLINSTVSSCGLFGISSRNVRLITSSATGNGTRAECGTRDRPCGDIAALRRPRLKNSSCGTSFGREGTLPWGVCTAD